MLVKGAPDSRHGIADTMLIFFVGESGLCVNIDNKQKKSQRYMLTKVPSTSCMQYVDDAVSLQNELRRRDNPIDSNHGLYMCCGFNYYI